MAGVVGTGEKVKMLGELWCSGACANAANTKYLYDSDSLHGGRAQLPFLFKPRKYLATLLITNQLARQQSLT